MVKHSRPSRKIKDDENNTFKKRVVNGKGFSTSGSATTDTSGLRRSARETSSGKQMISSPSSTRKSGRLEKRMPNTPPNKKKHESIERQRMPSPLRRSGRGKEQPSSSCLGSQKSEKWSGSSDMKTRNFKRDKDVKQSTLEGKEIGRSEKKEPEPIRMKKKRMDACAYKALFKQQLRRDPLQDTGEELVSPDKLSQVDSNNGGGSGSKQAEDGEDRVDVYSGRNGEESSEEFVEKTCETDLECFNYSLGNIDSDMLVNKGDKEPDKHSDGDGLDESKIGGIVEDIPNDVQSVGTTSVEVSLDGDNDQGSGKEVTPNKRKRNTMDMDSSASTTIACKDTFVADAVYSPSLECKRNISVRTCMACSERRRVDYDSPDQELCLCNATLNKDLCDTFIPEDRGELEASVNTRCADKCDDNIQQMESSSGMNTHQDACDVCKLGGKLLCCNGKDCKRSYHHSCLDPPLNEVPPGIWYCLWCVEKKIQCGVLSVSQGVESILDAREVVVSDAEGLRKRKAYFVKYKGLAHIYNRWVPQTQLDFEAPLLVAEFSQNNQATRWKQEWTVPHRLLMKRLLTPMMRDVSSCCYEWLVKWRGLGDDHCTWELENASFLRSPRSQSLVRKYENRRKKAKRDTLVSQNKNDYSIKLSKLPVGIPCGLGYNNLKYVNKLREYWHKGQNSVVIDDQKRVTRVVLFILSLLPDVCQSFLIIASSDSVSLWEYEFLRLMPSISVLVYSGNKDTRKNIRTFEFNEESGCMMFQVLISPPEAVVEDLEMLECLKWEAVIVDECQWSGISTHFDQIKILATDVWVLLFSDQIKYSIAEYLNLLEFLDSCGDLEHSGGSKTDSQDNLSELKRRLSRFIAYECNSDSSRFVEYLVPAWLSNVQLEQYCATLLSNSFSLCSTSKTDNVGAFRDILISTRKCCDHPYIVDPSLQGLITKELPEVKYLDVGIKASGKLQLLETMLSKIKDQQLRVVILFQSIGGSGRDSIGDILDDFVRQRFGPNSYERVDGVVHAKKKQAALNRFNSKDSGKFVFLLENRACASSIKLSSVDTIIIYNSDWNPSNDLRLLHRVSLDSLFDKIKVFRLYTSYTVEEKVLILAKDDLTLDSNLMGISRSTSHALLMWGALYLFEKLDQFHGGTISSEESLLKDVVKDFLPLLSRNFEKNEPTSSVILKVQKTGGNHNRNILLFGERKINLTGTEPHIFWKGLLDGMNPQWKYSSGKLQRNRKRVQYCNHLPDVVGKKPKKLVSVGVCQTSLNPGPGEGEIAGEKGVASVISALDSGIPADYGSQSLPTSTASSSDTLNVNNASILPYFSNNMSSLPEVHLVESEKRTLRNMQKSLHTSMKPVISKLCEILQLSEDVKVMVGRFLGYVIDNHYLSNESVTILQAFQISVCWIAASLMKQKIDRKETLVLAKKHLSFSCKEEEANNIYSKLRSLKQAFLCNTKNVTESESEHITEDQQNVKLEIDERLQNQKNCENRMAKLQKQREEIRELYRIWEDEMVQIQKKHRLESALVRSIHSHIPVRTDKLKVLDNEFARKLEEHKLAKERRLKDLKAKHLKERKEQIRIGSADPISDSGDLREERSSEGILHNVESSEALPVDFPKTGPGQVVECNTHVGTSTLALNPNWENDEVEAIDPERRSVAGLEQRKRLSDFRDGLENAVLVNQPSEEQISVGARTSLRDQEDPLEMPRKVGASHFMEIMMPDIESNREDEERDESDMPDAVENLSDSVCGSVEGHSLSTEPSLEKSELVQQVITIPVQGGQLQQYMPLRDELSQQSTHTGIQDGDAAAGGDQIILPQVEIAALHPSDAGPTDQTNHVPVLLEPVSQPQPRPSTDLPNTSFQNAKLPLQTVQNPPELSNQLLSPPGAIDSSLGPNQPNSSSSSRYGFCANPLQDELERLCKDRDQLIKVHEETKLRLRSDCEKEIEDIVAQIRSKYEAKLEDAEATFLLQKKELDTNQNIVLMNKILAQAFRSKCLDLKHSGTLGSQRAVPPSFMQHPHQHTPRPHHVPTSSSSAGPLVASQQTTVPPVQAQYSSDLFPRIPTIPPHISPITPTGNVQVRATRAPAPHIQPFRHSTSMPKNGIPSLPVPCGMPGQPALNNLHATSLSVPQLQPPTPQLLAHHSGPYSRLSQTEIPGGSSAFHNSSPSAPEFVIDVDNRSGAHPHNNLPPVPELRSNFDSSDLSEYGALGNVAVDSNNSGVGADIVCLSNDE